MASDQGCGARQPVRECHLPCHVHADDLPYFELLPQLEDEGSVEHFVVHGFIYFPVIVQFCQCL